MRSKSRKALLVLMTVILALGVQILPAGSRLGISGQQVYGAVNLSISMTSDTTAIQGDQNMTVTFKVINKSGGKFIFDGAAMEFENAQGLTSQFSSTGTVTLDDNESTDINFKMDVDRSADTGKRAVGLILKNSSAVVYEDSDIGSITIYERNAAPSHGSSYLASLDVAYSINPSSGFAPGQSNTLNLEIINNGNTLVKNVQANLTMPDGLSVDNASSTVSLGYISTGKKAKLSFPIAVEDDAKTKNYAISLDLSGLDHFESNFSLKKTLYVSVNGTGASTKNADIININVPDKVSGQDPFNLSFDVVNKSNADMKNMKITVDVPEGLLNKTRSTFVEKSIPAGGSKNYSVTMFASDGAKAKAYPIKISLASSTAKDDSDSVIQYASVYIDAASGVKTPQLMVDDYSYGGTYVQAGDEFILKLGLFNTSAQNLTNIKVTLTSEDGTFVPVNSSNSFFIDKLEKKGHTSHSLCLAVKPAAEQKTTAITVDMSYEDGSSNPFTSKDVISIPIMQETRLDVDDVVAPPELYAGMQSGVSVQFYNMGKTVLNNLRVTAEGDFDTQESTSYFVGNLEGGKSDTYDFSFIPRKAGPMEGKIIFTYEDASGEQQVLERPFSFQVMDAPPADEGGAPPDGTNAGGGKGKLPWIIGGAVIWAAAIGIFIWRKIKKKKINREMEIDE